MRYSLCTKMTRLVFALPVVAVITLLTAACGGDGGDTGAPTPEASATPAGSGPAEQALAAYVQSTLQRPFVEDCTKADIAGDVNKICSTFRGERGNQRAYVIGPTFSEPSQWVIIEDRGGQWAVAGTTILNADTAGVPGIPWPLRTGVDLVVAAQPDPCLNVRTAPKREPGNAVDCIANGTRVRLVAGPTNADGFDWWQIEGRNGWVSGDYLRYPDAAQ